MFKIQSAGHTLDGFEPDLPPEIKGGATQSQIIICPNTPQVCSVNAIILLLLTKLKAPDLVNIKRV